MRWRGGLIQVSFLLPDLCLIFVTSNQEAFAALHDAQAQVNERLTQNGLLSELDEAIQNPPFSIRRNLVSTGSVTSKLWHFMFKMTSRSQVRAHLRPSGLRAQLFP